MGTWLLWKENNLCKCYIPNAAIIVNLEVQHLRSSELRDFN